MIKLVTGGIVCLGFTEQDFEKLKSGHPILIPGSSVKRNEHIFICSGEDDFDIFSKLKKSNFIVNEDQLFSGNKH